MNTHRSESVSKLFPPYPPALALGRKRSLLELPYVDDDRLTTEALGLSFE